MESADTSITGRLQLIHPFSKLLPARSASEENVFFAFVSGWSNSLERPTAMLIRHLVTLGVIAVSFGISNAADPIIFMNATIYTGVGTAPIVNGTMVVQDGKIVSINEAAPNGTVIDLAGATIIPGLVDTHSHIGIYPKPSVPAHQDGMK